VSRLRSVVRPRTPPAVVLRTRDLRAAGAVVLAGLAAPLGGCATTDHAKVAAPTAPMPTPAAQSAAEAQAALQRRIAVCRSRYPAGSPHFLDKARCDEAARRAALLASGTPADLADAYLATRTEVAGRLDRGEITRERAERELAAAAAETNERAAAQARRRHGATPDPGIIPGAAAPGVVASALRPPSGAHPLPPPVPVRPGAPQ
jgi:hypothetical protein